MNSGGEPAGTGFGDRGAAWLCPRERIGAAGVADAAGGVGVEAGGCGAGGCDMGDDDEDGGDANRGERVADRRAAAARARR